MLYIKSKLNFRNNEEFKWHNIMSSTDFGNRLDRKSLKRILNALNDRSTEDWLLGVAATAKQVSNMSLSYVNLNFKNLNMSKSSTDAETLCCMQHFIIFSNTAASLLLLDPVGSWSSSKYMSNSVRLEFKFACSAVFGSFEMKVSSFNKNNQFPKNVNNYKFT